MERWAWRSAISSKSGASTTPSCKVMPAYKEQRGQARIQIDGIMPRERRRRPRRTGRACARSPAGRPSGSSSSPLDIVPSDRDLKYIGSLLDGLPVLAGDRIRATLFGNRSADFRVREHGAQGPGADHPDHAAGDRQAVRRRGQGGRRSHLLRGHRRPARRQLHADPRDRRVAAALPRGVRAAGHRRRPRACCCTARRAAARR